MKRSMIVAILLALVAVACADGAQTESAAPAGNSNSDLPDVEVVDVVTGATVNVSALAPGDKPLLVWFWAPH